MPSSSLLKICGGALLLLIATLLLKESKMEIWPLRWLGILLITLATLALLSPLIAWIREISTSHGLNEYADLLFRALVVAIITQCCSDLCRQSGEASLASGVELAGKAELILLSLPLVRQLINIADSLLNLS